MRPVLRIGAAVLLAATGTALPAPAAAGQTPPDLPTPATGGCVGASAVTASAPPWALRTLAPQDVWPLTLGPGVSVAVVDTGVSATAPALIGSVQPGTDVAGGAADSDCRGRGTALAGIVAARPVSGSGFTGMAPGATIVPIRITDPDGKLTAARLTAGIRAASAAKARIILVGTGVTSPTADLAAAVEDAVAQDALVVAAVSDTAVTDNAPNPPAAYPAAYPAVLAVNGLDTAGTPVPVPAVAGVDLAAPGAGAISIAPTGGGHYTVKGTAVAAAYVAGAAALLRAYRPDLTQAQVRARLEQTARPAPGGERTDSLGAGTLDPYAAVTALVPRQATDPVLAVGQPVTVPVQPHVPASARIAAATVLGSAAVAALVFSFVTTRRRSRRQHSADPGPRQEHGEAPPSENP